MARNTITIATGIDISSCSGSGPTYTAEYSSYDLITLGIKVGDWITANKRVAGAGGSSTISSVYTYQVIAIIDMERLTIKYISDSNGDGDDSPWALPSGTGSSGSPNKAPHTFYRDLGAAFLMFVD